MLRTSSGRLSKTIIVSLAGAALQAVPAVAAFQGLVQPLTWAIIALVLAFVQSFATIVVRQLTNEPMDASAKAKKAKKGSSALFLLLLVGCGHAAWDEKVCPVEGDVRKCRCQIFNATASEGPDGWLVRYACDGKDLPLTVRSAAQPEVK